MLSFEDVLVMGGIKPLKPKGMNWTDYEERYGESREDFIDTAEDVEMDSCKICGALFPPDELQEVEILGKKQEVCTECLDEIRNSEEPC